MAIYATSANYGRAGKEALRKEGQAAPQPTANYTGVKDPAADGRPGSTPGPRDQDAAKRAGAGARYTGQAAPKVYTKAAPPVATQPGVRGDIRAGNVRAGALPAGGRPTVAVNPQQPQVRDRAFSMGEQQYRAGPVDPRQAALVAAGSRFGPGNEVVKTVGAPAQPTKTSVRTEPTRAGAAGMGGGFSGPNAGGQPRLADMLGQTQSSIPNGMQAAAGVASPVPGAEPSPTAGLSVLGPNTNLSAGGAGTAGPGYNDVQTRQDSYTDNADGSRTYGYNLRDAGQAAQDFFFGTDAQAKAAEEGYAARGDDIENAVNDGGGGNTVFEAVTNQAPPDLHMGGDNGNESPLTDFATWMATMMGEPFGAAATKLNEYGRKTKDSYYDNWADLQPMQDVGLKLMDPNYIKQYEDAARNRMQTSVGQERDQAARDLMGQAGRGGAIGTGRETGINNSAMRAMMEGEQRLLEDSFRRKLASEQLGAGIYGDAQRAKYGALEGGDVSPGELAGIVLPFLADIFGSGMEGLGGAMGGGPGPIPGLELLGLGG